jgi:hypothetical protein
VTAEKTLTDLARIADKNFGGHFAVMKFTTNWRVGFGTPGSRCDIDQMWEGKTFAAAASAALAGYRHDGSGGDITRCETHETLLRGGFIGECPYCGDILPAR